MTKKNILFFLLTAVNTNLIICASKPKDSVFRQIAKTVLQESKNQQHHKASQRPNFTPVTTPTDDSQGNFDAWMNVLFFGSDTRPDNSHFTPAGHPYWTDPSYELNPESTFKQNESHRPLTPPAAYSLWDGHSFQAHGHVMQNKPHTSPQAPASLILSPTNSNTTQLDLSKLSCMQRRLSKEEKRNEYRKKSHGKKVSWGFAPLPASRVSAFQRPSAAK